jgi:hypothetical protein
MRMWESPMIDQDHTEKQEAACRALLAMPPDARVDVLHQFCNGCGKHDTELPHNSGPCMCDVDPE